MIVKNSKAFIKGSLLALSFFGILLVIFAPIFGDGQNGLVFSDAMFNRLSKGSSYFIPKVREGAQAFAGTTFSVTIKLDQPAIASAVLAKAGMTTKTSDAGTAISGDLGKLLASALNDADAMFANDGAKIAARYARNEKEVMEAWWSVLKATDKAMKKQHKVEEANAVSAVMKKGVEPAYNFYGIESQKVTEKAGLMTGLLIFYVIYTMWWGFAIFYLFEAVGLTMKKAKVKKEV